MPKVIKTIGIGVIIALVILIISCLVSKNTRQSEIDTSLNTAIEQTIKVVHDERYKINSNEELVAEFNHNFFLELNSNSKTDIIIYDVDYQKGLLDVEIKSTFKYPHGVEDTVTSRKTMIIDEIKNR